MGGDDSIEYDLFAIDNRQENDDDQQIYFCDIDAIATGGNIILWNLASRTN